ncbi:MAG TPA: hypothetical protein DF383_09185 [Deltaproteobacteria bacterium]|nr:hypothetical protein [Deltaproteobacteria bacterium]
MDSQAKTRRIALFIALSLLLHVLLGAVFYEVNPDKRKAAPLPPPQQVVWVNPQDLLPLPPAVVSAANLQIADIAKPKVEKRPDRTHFAAKYNSSVKQESVASKIPPRAKLETESAEDGRQGDNATEEAAQKTAGREAPPPRDDSVQEKTEKEISLKDLSLKPADFQDLVPKDRPKENPKKQPAKKESWSRGEDYVSPLKGRPGAPGDPDSFVHDFFPDVKIGGKTYLNTAAFPDVQYFTQLKRIFRMRFNPAPPLRAHLAGHKVVVGKVSVAMAVTVNAQGRLQELFVIKSSGIPGYDAEAMRTIRQSAPFSAPPSKVMDKDGVLRMNWNFITYL